MKVPFKTLHFRRLAACLAVFVMTLAVIRVVVARAASATPTSLFQYSTLTGSNNTITATRIPVVTASGTTIYKDLTLQFDVDSVGDLTIAPGFPQIVPTVAPVASNFLAGNYVGPSNRANFLISVSGPGVTTGGATEWSLAASPGAAACTFPSSATWYVGALASNPLATRLQKASITSTAWNYGVGSATCAGQSWGTDSILGFSQTGNTLTIVSFTWNGSDYSTPVDQITYTLKQ